MRRFHAESVSLDSEIMFLMWTKTILLIPHKRVSPVLTSTACLIVSPPFSPALKPLHSHIPGLHLIHLQIFTLGGLHHPAPCHCGRPGFTVCLLHSGASGPNTGEAPTYGSKGRKGTGPTVECFSNNLAVFSYQYPHEVPQISIRNPRGLSDEQIHK